MIEKPYESSEQPTTRKRGAGSCLLWGCLITFGLVLVMVIAAVAGGHFFLSSQVTKYTSETPADLPVVEYTEEAVEEIKTRIETFKTDVEEGRSPGDLVLTADEINALIAENDELQGKVHVSIADDQVSGEISIPADPFPGGKGRFFNATASFNVALENGVLIVTLADATVKGEPLPPQFLEAMGRENLAKDAYKDPKVAEMLAHFESLTIKDDMIILSPRPQSGGGDSGDMGSTDELPDDSESVDEGTAVELEPAN